MSSKQGLNKQQLDAVTAPLGPVLILAGAGSGKTKALTMRIIYLMHKLNFRPENILAVTFTNKAAGEMKERLGKLMDKKKMALPTMGTFHSIGVKILRMDGSHLGITPNFVIYDDDDQENLLKEVLAKLKIDPTKFKPSLFAHIIDRAKNNLEDPYDIDEGDKNFARMARNVYKEYQEQLLKNNAVDFGDLIMLPVRLFQKFPEVLEKYQNRWQYVLIDEYQDTNHAQYVYTNLLTSKHRNLFVVGDDAQAIYGFRGANLQNILDFEKDYPDAHIVRLEQNYRSTAPILSIAEKIIALNTQQHKKALWTENSEGTRPTLYRAADEMAEAWFVATKIIEHQDGVSEELKYEADEDEGILSRIMKRSQFRAVTKLQNRKGLNNYAVLYRTHAQSRAIEEVLIESSIPYQIVGGLKFYERKEIKDILAYLRLLVNPNDIVGLKRVINTPPRGIGPKSFDMLKDALVERNDKAMAELFNQKPNIKTFFEALDFIRNLDEGAELSDIMRQLIKTTGYESFLRDGSEEGEGRWENIQELFNVASSFGKYPWKEGMEKFLEEVALMTATDEFDAESDKITLMTLHQAKGLEFDTVFLVGLEEGILPHARSVMEPKDIAEEVRLAYVGVTRARKHLYLVHAMSRKQFGMRNASIPSRILKAIPEELIDVIEYTF
ncbi:MAG TPA: UvrD-helicase domain-containing protein [Verrucomicrobiae bacterium]|nr:UvrD-helicase domain-containing protein [Verrucomicrobiae bacterium]